MTREVLDADSDSDSELELEFELGSPTVASMAIDKSIEMEMENSNYSLQICKSLLKNTSAVQSYTEDILGPTRTADVTYLVTVMSLYSILLVAAVIANVLMAVVIARKVKTQSTNFYLLNLLLSDLLLAVTGIPFELLNYVHAYPWWFGEVGCILRCISAECASYATVLTITIFTFERYFAVARPVQMRLSSRCRTLMLLAVIWALSFAPAVLMGSQFGVVQLNLSEEPSCFIPGTDLCLLMLDREIPHSLMLSTVLFFFFPMVIIVTLHSLIAIRVRRSTRLITSMGDRSDSHSHSHSHTLVTSLQSQSDSVAKQRHRALSMPNCAQKQMAITLADRAQLLRVTVTNPRGVVTTDTRWKCTVQHKAPVTSMKLNKMLIVVCCCFFICFCPFMLQRLFARNVNIDGDETMELVHTYLYFITGFLYYSSATINPIIYTLMSKNLRESLMVELRRLRDNINGRFDSLGSSTSIDLRAKGSRKRIASVAIASHFVVKS